ncbi:MAG: DNA alkylation repair protein [Aquiluna sp.]|jgi:3-methyladenine DNA glycosylase AlkD|nr:DNA alkylation repair protein [Aquiluna sp.]
MTAQLASQRLRSMENPRRAREMEWFFKSEPGGYGEGDRFLGLTVPQTRGIAAEFLKLELSELGMLFSSEYHEERFCALVVLTRQFERAKDHSVRARLFDYYLSQYDLGAINSWDLVDVSANRFGRFWEEDPNRIEKLIQRAKSPNLWIQRSAVILTFPMISNFDFEPTLEVARQLVYHPHDLIHKAVGWSLREVGKRELTPLRSFLEEFASTMPRTALRYAIEKLGESERQQWLTQKKSQ